MTLWSKEKVLPSSTPLQAYSITSIRALQFFWKLRLEIIYQTTARVWQESQWDSGWQDYTMNLYHLAFIHFQNLWIFHSYKIHFPLFTSNTFLHTLLSLTLLRTYNQKDICLVLNWHYNTMAGKKKHWNYCCVAQYTHVQHTH